MDIDFLQRTKKLIEKHEGFREFPYSCPAGNLTIGFGRNLEKNGISRVEAEFLLEEDINFFYSVLKSKLPFFKNLSKSRQIALIDMCYNLGVHGFLEFKKMLCALRAKKYDDAADEMMKSKWAEQVGDRAYNLSEIIREGCIY